MHTLIAPRALYTVNSGAPHPLGDAEQRPYYVTRSLEGDGYGTCDVCDASDAPILVRWWSQPPSEADDALEVRSYYFCAGHLTDAFWTSLQLSVRGPAD